MKAVVIAMLLLGAGFVAVAAAPTASACAVSIDDPGEVVECAGIVNEVIDTIQCVVLRHC